ncbi:hypothetical protein [Kitasatospora terrestris]|uniref:hypothetical protein n=1 Tax=Kitasatospora terrestris TaxID=258051 RepID=UPI0031E8B4C9
MRKSAVVLCGVAAVGAVALLLVPATVPETSSGDTAVTAVRINGGRSLELGPGESLTFPVEVVATDDSGIRTVDPIGLWGPGYGALKVAPLVCTPLDPAGRAASCRGTATVTAPSRQLYDDQAGTWFVDLRVRAKDGDRYVAKAAAGFSLKRAARLVDATAPERAALGERVTVAARLQQADWDRNGFRPRYGSVALLQFRPSGSSVWTTVASAGADRDGLLRAEVPATGTGEFQWWAPGDQWTGPALSPPQPIAVAPVPVHDDGPAA